MELVVDCRTGARRSCVAEVGGTVRSWKTIRRGSASGIPHHHHRQMRRALWLELGGFVN